MMRMAVLVAALVAAAGLPHIRAQSSLLPDRESFLREARKRLASNELLQSRYSYRERVTDVRLNPFGAIGTGPVEVYEIYPMVPGQLTYRRLVARGGAPVPPAELLLADRQFLARYYQWQRDIAREGRTSVRLGCGARPLSGRRTAPAPPKRWGCLPFRSSAATSWKGSR